MKKGPTSQPESREGLDRRSFFKTLIDPRTPLYAWRGAQALKTLGDPKEGDSGFEETRELRSITRRNWLIFNAQVAFAALIGAVATVAIRSSRPPKAESFAGLGLGEKVEKPSSSEAPDKSVPPKIAALNEELQDYWEAKKSTGEIKSLLGMWTLAYTSLVDLIPKDNQRAQASANFLTSCIDGFIAHGLELVITGSLQQSSFKIKDDLPVTRPVYLRDAKKGQSTLYAPSENFSPNLWAGVFMYMAAEAAFIADKMNADIPDEGALVKTGIAQVASDNAFELVDFLSDGRLEQAFHKKIGELMGVSDGEVLIRKLEEINNEIFGEDLSKVDVLYKYEILNVLISWLQGFNSDDPRIDELRLLAKKTRLHLDDLANSEARRRQDARQAPLIQRINEVDKLRGKAYEKLYERSKTNPHETK